MSRFTDTKTIRRAAERAGWEVGVDGRGHLRLTPPEGAAISVSTTSGDVRSWRNNLAKIKRAGLDIRTGETVENDSCGNSWHEDQVGHRYCPSCRQDWIRVKDVEDEILAGSSDGTVVTYGDMVEAAREQGMDPLSEEFVEATLEYPSYLAQKEKAKADLKHEVDAMLEALPDQILAVLNEVPSDQALLLSEIADRLETSLPRSVISSCLKYLMDEQKAHRTKKGRYRSLPTVTPYSEPLVVPHEPAPTEPEEPMPAEPAALPGGRPSRPEPTLDVGPREGVGETSANPSRRVQGVRTRHHGQEGSAHPPRRRRRALLRRPARPAVLDLLVASERRGVTGQSRKRLTLLLRSDVTRTYNHHRSTDRKRLNMNALHIESTLAQHCHEINHEYVSMTRDEWATHVALSDQPSPRHHLGFETPSDDNNGVLRFCPDILAAAAETIDEGERESFLVAIMWIIDTETASDLLTPTERATAADDALAAMALRSLNLVSMAQFGLMD